MSNFKYRFTSDTGRTIVITTDKKLTAKQRREYMECLPGVVSYVREPVDNPPAKPVKLVNVMEGLADLVDVLQAENDLLKARVQELEEFIGSAQVLSGVCCCGESMLNHSSAFDSGHSPVDIWDHSVEQLLDRSPAQSLALLKAEVLDSEAERTAIIGGSSTSDLRYQAAQLRKEAEG